MNQDHLSLTRRQLLAAGVTFSALAAGGIGLTKHASADEGTPVKGGVLQFAVTDASQGEKLDPIQSLNQHQGIYCSLIWDYLLDFDANYGPLPRLATKTEVNEDASKWTFTLRDDVKWHDGSPFTSEDVAWTVLRILDEKNGSPFLEQASAALDATRISTPDPHTIVFSLKSPDTLFPLLFLEHGAQIVKRGWSGDGVVSHAIGTGAFMVKEWSAGNGFELVRNPNYWRGDVYLDGVRSVVIPDPASKVQSVISGSSHTSDSIPPVQAVIAAASSSVELIRNPAAHAVYLTMDATHKPFDNPDVRMAFKLVLDRKQVLDTVFNGFGVLGVDCSAPVGNPMFPPSLHRERNVDAAKTLLAKAGYPNGIDVELIAAPVVGGIDDLAVAYAAAAKDAGIRVSIKQWPVDTYFDEVWLKKPFYVDYLQREHPLKALQLSFLAKGSWNETHVPDTKIDAFVHEGLKQTDPARQIDIIQQAMLWQANNEGVILPVFTDRLILRKRNLHGIGPSMFARPLDYSRAWIADA